VSWDVTCIGELGESSTPQGDKWCISLGSCDGCAGHHLFAGGFPFREYSRADLTNSTTDVPSARSLAYRDWLILLGFCAYLFFYGLGNFGLMGADEPRYAQVAREMLARHDWITPTLGGQPWLEKPVLYYWQAMLAFSIFGVKDWVARMPSAVDATLMVLGVYLFLRRFRPGFQLDGALMTASMAGMIGFARASSTDMPLSATITLALLGWYAWYESAKRKYLALFYLCIALGTLAKGPVAIFIAGVVVALFAAAKRDFKPIWRTLWSPGIAIFLVIALPWYIAVQSRNPEFFRIFFLEHNLARFGTNLYHHKEPFWYYLPVTLAGLLPWTVFVLAAIVEVVRAWWAEKRSMLAGEDAFNAFLLIWLLAPVIFFSISQSKLPGYILPGLPAGTLLLAEYVRRKVNGEERPPLILSVLHCLLAAMLLAPALLLQYLVLRYQFLSGTAAIISGVLALAIAIGMIITLRSGYGFRALRFVTLVPVVLAVAAVLRIGAPALDAKLSARPLAEELSSVDRQNLPLAVFKVSREAEFGLAFYRNQVISRYEWGQIPAGEHLVIGIAGSQPQIAKHVPGRRVSYLGSFKPQGLEYFWVAGESQ